MSQERLNSLMVLYAHKHHTENIALVEIANEFVSKNEHRFHIFGLIN